MEQSMAELERRVGSAEAAVNRLRRVLRWTCAFLLAVALVGAVLFMARPAASQEEEATILKAPVKVVDGQGTTILSIDFSAQQARTPIVRLLNGLGKPVIELKGDARGGEIHVCNESGFPSAVLTNAVDGSGGLGLIPGPKLENGIKVYQGLPLVLLQAMSEGTGRLLLLDPKGKIGAELRSKSGGELSLNDGTGARSISLAASPKGGTLVLNGADGKPLFTRP